MRVKLLMGAPVAPRLGDRASVSIAVTDVKVRLEWAWQCVRSGSVLGAVVC